jgi:hypothetical protein
LYSEIPDALKKACSTFEFNASTCPSHFKFAAEVAVEHDRIKREYNMDADTGDDGLHPRMGTRHFIRRRVLCEKRMIMEEQRRWAIDALRLKARVDALMMARLDEHAYPKVK